MKASVGDRIVIDSEKVGVPAREGVVLEVIEADYGTRYHVRWADGHESTIHPTGGGMEVIAATPEQRVTTG
jgi:hypothetical protein